MAKWAKAKKPKGGPPPKGAVATVAEPKTGAKFPKNGSKDFRGSKNGVRV